MKDCEKLIYSSCKVAFFVSINFIDNKGELQYLNLNVFIRSAGNDGNDFQKKIMLSQSIGYLDFD